MSIEREEGDKAEMLAAWNARADDNLIEQLVGALELVKPHLSELREAWRSGALNSSDSLNALRANRNIAVESGVNKVLAAARARGFGNVDVKMEDL